MANNHISPGLSRFVVTSFLPKQKLLSAKWGGDRDEERDFTPFFEHRLPQSVPINSIRLKGVQLERPVEM
jgi:hypothetical protein